MPWMYRCTFCDYISRALVFYYAVYYSVYYYLTSALRCRYCNPPPHTHTHIQTLTYTPHPHLHPYPHPHPHPRPHPHFISAKMNFHGTQWQKWWFNSTYRVFSSSDFALKEPDQRLHRGGSEPIRRDSPEGAEEALVGTFQKLQFLKCQGFLIAVHDCAYSGNSDSIQTRQVSFHRKSSVDGKIQFGWIYDGDHGVS